MFSGPEDHHEFKPLLVEIEDKPLNPLGRLVFWIVIAALLFLVVWLCLGRVDVVVTARGKVIPAGEVKVIQPLTSGVVNNILVQPGQLVAAGELLMEIDPTDTEPELASMQADLKQVELEMLRIEALLTDAPFAPREDRYEPELVNLQRQLLLSETKRLARRIKVRRDELEQISSQLAGVQETLEKNRYLLEIGRGRVERLASVRDLVSRDEYERASTEVATYAAELDSARYKLEELRAAKMQVLEQIRLIEEEHRQELLGELTEKGQERLYLKARIDRTEFVNARQQIRSPVRGHVSRLMVHTVGGVVSPAEKLAIVVPADSRPVVKVRVMNSDVGYLSPDMPVKIKVDTFEFQRYGMLEGKLQQIARDSVEDERLGLVYDAWIDPLETTLKVDGVATEISPGMSVSAEIMVGERRMIEFFLYPLVKYLNEGTSVR